MINVIISGGPGCGKGTQSDLISERFQLAHLSTGHLLRIEIANFSEIGREAQGYIAAGNLVPDEMILRLLAKTVDELPVSHGVIFDGYPRNVAQAEALDKLMEERGKQIDIFLDLQVPDEVMVERMMKRAQTSNRSDDTPETCRHRVQVYHEQTAPVKDYYVKKGICQTVDATGTIESIFREIEKIFSKMM